MASLVDDASPGIDTTSIVTFTSISVILCEILIK